MAGCVTWCEIQDVVNDIYNRQTGFDRRSHEDIEDDVRREMASEGCYLETAEQRYRS